MRPRRPSVLSLTALGLALVAAACSDPISSPSLRAPAGSPAFTLGPTANVGPVQVTLNSSATTQFCTAGTVIHGYTIPATYAPLAGCGTAFSLESNIETVYNPGWSAPFTGSQWIGPNATSNEYRTAPGTYVFQTTFTVPAGATSPVLNLTLKSDNAVAVFLNGSKVEQQVIADCGGAPCNWDAGGTFVISDNTHIVTGVNTITILLVDTPNGGTAANGYACTKTPQPNGWKGFVFDAAHAEPTSPNHIVANWTQTMTATTGCENPTGLDFSGTVSWVAPPPPQICDFITFGRLVVEVGGQKVVISGNAGGNAPDGGILGEIEISIGGVDYHVHTIDSYFKPTNAPLANDPFARVITGKSGANNIELRLRDDPNPGQGEPTGEGDKVWLKINGVVVVPTQTPDQGNVQLHLNCRGPGD